MSTARRVKGGQPPKRLLNKQYDMAQAELDAQIAAALTLGQDVAEVARTYEVSRGYVEKIRDLYPKEGGPDIDAVLTRLVTEGAETVLAIYRHAQNQAWLEEQSADSLAGLVDTIGEQVFRIAAAAGRAAERHRAAIEQSVEVEAADVE